MEDDKDLVIEREFDAPPEQVWQDWIEESELKKWRGPKNFTSPVAQTDLRVGSKYLFCMRGPGSDDVVKDFWSTGIYREIVPLEKLVISDSFADENGNVVPSSHYGMEGFPLELEIQVALESVGENKTKITIRQKGVPQWELRDQTKTGWQESFDKLAESSGK